MSFDYKRLRKKYNDPYLEFFYTLLPETKKNFKEILPLLKNAYLQNDKIEWKKLKKALLIIGKCMYIPELYKIKRCSLKEYQRIEIILVRILNYSVPLVL
jgi:hypothetical protein